VLPKIDREQTATTQLASRLYAGKLCVVCEGPLERKSERQRICGKRKCAAKYKANRAYYLLAGRGVAGHDVVAQKTPDFIDSKQAIKPDRP
jgi:hypothetical protein